LLHILPTKNVNLPVDIYIYTSNWWRFPYNFTKVAEKR